MTFALRSNTVVGPDFTVPFFILRQNSITGRIYVCTPVQ